MTSTDVLPFISLIRRLMAFAELNAALAAVHERDHVSNRERLALARVAMAQS